MRDARRRAGFLIAGVQKAATSTLYAMLAEHPQIATAKSKELHFFDDDRRDWANPNYARYQRQMAWGPASVIAGEATPRYIFWPGALERIAAYNPAMRLVVSFRDPIERTFSHWSMIKARNSHEPDFSAVVRAYPLDRLPRTAAEVGRASRNFVGRGFYGEQLDRALAMFPREQLLLLDYHRMFGDVRATLDGITDFLGLDRFSENPEDIRRRPQPELLTGAPPTAADVTRLAGLYADDLQRFEALCDVEVSRWPTRRVLTGDLDPAELAAVLAAKAGLVGAK